MSKRYSVKKNKPAPGIMLLCLSILSSILLFNRCTEKPVPDPELSITGISIPSELLVYQGDLVSITGKGFEAGDQIQLSSTGDDGLVYTITISSCDEQSASFILPDDFKSGTYRITVIRGDETQVIGTVSISVSVNLEIPDIEGMTIKGIVYCDGKGIPGVAVSDGYEVTLTDANGVYYLASDKKYKYVFISVPGNYEVANEENLPQFYKRLAGASSVERKDFSLVQVDNDKHVVLMMADWHLANRNSDISQFTSGFLQDLNSTIASYTASGTKVYGMTLGDMTWDLYWYTNQFALPEYLVQMYNINCTMFNLMGNHDNDPYCVGDWAAEQAYKDVIGPTYYSFNLGEVHYIILDDTEYINTGASEGVVGERNYSASLTDDQMTWLERDLATITDPSTPIIIGMHIPFYQPPVVDENGNYTPQVKLKNSSAFLSLIEGFSNVHVLSGHAHMNYKVSGTESFMEHNTGAVCATWWWTGKPGYAGNHICPDGSPGGFEIWNADGKTVSWQYKGVGYNTNYQFRSYDLNSIQITAADYAPNSTDEALAPYVGEYASPGFANEVLINVWNFDDDWSIEVTENGVPLEVSRVNAKDPLHIISYEALRLNAGAIPSDGFVTNSSSHFFKVTASGAETTLEIRVTDRFGNEYTETMLRPKALSYDMK